MKIGELAQRSGLTASRIRFYEAQGLIQAAQRQANGYRDYPPNTALTLAIITSAQQAGFSLDEIRSILPTSEHGWDRDRLLDMLRRKIADIEALERKLAANKAQLQTVIDQIENHPDDLPCELNAQIALDKMCANPAFSSE